MTSLSPREPTPVTLPVSELIAMSDEQLCQFMKEHRDANGDYSLPVDGWDKLSKDERERLASRLKAKERVLSLDNEPSSRPLDLDALDARLRQAPPDNPPTEVQDESQVAGFSRHASPGANHRAHSKEVETIYYRQLLDDGGRPLYPIELIDEVLEKPEEYRELIQPLQNYPGNNQPFNIFLEQNARWKDFRKWQKDNRGLEDENDTYEAFVKETSFWEEQSNLDWAQMRFEAEMKRNPLHLESQWRYEMKARNRQRLRCRERDCNGPADYFEAVKRRLASHDITRPFQLKEDPKQQDQLTTWTEYLGYEYWCLDGHAEDMERLAPKHDEAWKKLVDAKIVGPHESIDDIRSVGGSLRRDNDAQQAHTEVRMAKAEAQRVFNLTQESPERFLISEKQRVEMLNKVARDVERAERRHKRVKVRNDRVSAFVSGTHDYARAKMKWTCHSLYVQWVLKQLPLVEAEMAQAEEEKSRASQNKGKKRMVSPQEESPAGPSQKRQKTGQGSLSPTNGNSNKSAEGTTQGKEKSQSSRPIKAIGKRSCRATNVSSLPPGGLRRSARIAARQPLPQPEPRQLRPRPTKKTEKPETIAGSQGSLPACMAPAKAHPK
ncbi:uncharacterized protein NECHADRAFT_78164 [Fusarium vanettenii 77-13-4]|uniref:Uncharacterized protein n=1 Tax=Fusarium vanettenii (strain ATCC MYA-4622 / CBS 123669 / FGSC 9596 / NRRL 45880 / 77-13-4) TaxID=660122 RepID=C7YNA8_FUSV7|nr:uncharacterized protein NECHADRAFT_78164 [Fusarium vanettenii 77-13-4]EEU47093.1 hypothetical protein NECHADRAFT_78164 [Fusarium vanettenii 77-13-4]